MFLALYEFWFDFYFQSNLISNCNFNHFWLIFCITVKYNSQIYFEEPFLFHENRKEQNLISYINQIRIKKTHLSQYDVKIKRVIISQRWTWAHVLNLVSYQTFGWINVSGINILYHFLYTARHIQYFVSQYPKTFRFLDWRIERDKEREREWVIVGKSGGLIQNRFESKRVYLFILCEKIFIWLWLA